MPDEQSAEQMNAFAAAVETDRALQEKLAAAASDYAAAVVAIAARAGDFQESCHSLAATQAA